MKVPYLTTSRIVVTEEFISSNKLSLIPSDEVKFKYESIKAQDFLGFSAEAYLPFMNWEDAKEYYKEEFRQKVDSGEIKYTNVIIEEAAQDFLDYMNFAWDKAQNMRGISASRSIEKLSAMLYCMNRADLAEEIQREELYNPYGAPALINICKKMRITFPESLAVFAEKKV